jgi:Carotenoid biosynthesis protein
MPYGAAPAWCFPVFEFSMYLLFIICLIHASKRGARDVMYILGGLAFGLILEYIEVITGSYTYSQFIIMFGKAPLHIPLCIGVGWGIIMYTARLFSDKLGLPLLAAAAFDTLLALNIDLSMDTVAYRLHMWHWNWSGTGLDPLKAQWFGIPFGNFVGWQTVVFCYSSFSRLFERKLASNYTAPLAKYVLIALLALVCSQAVLFTTETFLYPFISQHLDILSFHRFVGILVMLVVLTVWGWRIKKIQPGMLPQVAWWVPGWFHLFFAACFFLLGFYKENKWMTIAAVTNLLIGIVLHVFPLSVKNEKRAANPEFAQ